MDGITSCLESHRFKELFLEELGWDRASASIMVQEEDQDFIFEALAQKRGLLVLYCSTNRVVLANKGLLRRIQKRLVKSVHEQLVIYSCDKPRKQVWQWAVNQADGRKLEHREHPFFSNSPPAPFLARLEHLRFSLQEEESVTLLDALNRVRLALDVTAEQNLFSKRPSYAKRSDELACRVKQGAPGAFHEFVEFHLPLAKKSSRMLLRWFDMDPDDAEQIAIIGLIQAAQRFDPELGYQFSTYASYWIRQSCQRYGVECGLPIRIPVHAFWPCYRLQFEEQRLLAEYGISRARELFVDCLTNEKISSDQWTAFQASDEMRTFSDLTRDQTLELLALPDKDTLLTDNVLDNQLRGIIRQNIRSLRPREARVIMMRYGFDDVKHTLEEVGQLLGITRERVRQIQKRAEERLQFLLRKESLPLEAIRDRSAEDDSGIMLRKQHLLLDI